MAVGHRHEFSHLKYVKQATMPYLVTYCLIHCETWILKIWPGSWTMVPGYEFVTGDPPCASW